MNGLMAGKRGLIMGLANDKSLAWGIAKKLAEHGAELAFSYQGEALAKRVIPLAAELGKAVQKQVSPMRTTVTQSNWRRQVASVEARRLLRELAERA